jgi:ATP-dependent exoDNAse (exonuclease V) beta subunit
LVQKEVKDPFSMFRHFFGRELNTLSKESEQINKKLVLEMEDQAKSLCEKILPALNTKFEKYEVISVEEMLMEDMNDIVSHGKKFKGFIDLILKTPDGKYHIIDWKSCSWGWSTQKKTDPLTTYQLTYYKNYFSKKHNIDVKNINTYFALLKRTAKKDKVEILEVSSGQKKTTNALKLLQNAVINIENKNYVKNRLNCKYCKFYKTENCT